MKKQCRYSFKETTVQILFFVLLTPYLSANDGSNLTPNKGLATLEKHCSACHSLAIISQNRLTRSGWQDVIQWMQDKQGLWPLGKDESIILDYLSKHYAPIETGRRPPLAIELLPPK